MKQNKERSEDIRSAPAELEHIASCHVRHMSLANVATQHVVLGLGDAPNRASLFAAVVQWHNANMSGSNARLKLLVIYSQVGEAKGR